MDEPYCCNSELTKLRSLLLLQEELTLPPASLRALELSYLLLRAEGLALFKLDTLFLAAAHLLHAGDCQAHSRRRDCHFAADTPFSSPLKHLLKEEGGGQQNDSLVRG